MIYGFLQPDDYYQEIIEGNHPNDCEEATHSMYKRWLQIETNATWNQFVQAVTFADLKDAARELLQYIIEGM